MEALPDTSVKPGLHRPAQGRHRVVWWDPAALALKVERDFGLRQEEILAEDPGGGVTEEGRRLYQQWKSARDEAVEAGRDPRFSLFTASDAKDSPEDFTAPIHVEILERPPERPAGRRFGTLVHTMLRDVGLAAGAVEVEALAVFHGRAMNATPDEVSAARATVAATLGHPLLERARKASTVHRELPVLLNLEDGRTLEGSIDLAFEEDGRWVIIDFKTDADIESSRVKYERQLQWYLTAVARITGQPVAGWLLGC